MLHVVATQIPRCLLEGGFLLLDRTLALLHEATAAGAGDRCRRVHDNTDRLVVPTLTNLGHQLLLSRRIDEAEQVMILAIKIQEWLDHPMHAELLNPLLTLGKVYRHQSNLHQAAPVLTRCLLIAANTDGRYDEHEEVLNELIAVYSAQGRHDFEAMMRASLERLRVESRYLIKDRPNRRDE